MELPQLSDTEFGQVQTLMRQVSGIIMADHKKQLVAGRLMKRLKALGCRNFSEYVAYCWTLHNKTSVGWLWIY